MNAATLHYITRHYLALNKKVPLHPIRDEAGYDRAVAALNGLLDVCGSDESHPLAGLVDTLGGYIEQYDDRHWRRQLPEATGMDVLRFLMEQHGLRQSDLPEIGSQGVVSEILSGRRALNTRQIKALAARFGTNPAVFLA